MQEREQRQKLTIHRTTTTTTAGNIKNAKDGAPHGHLKVKAVVTKKGPRSLSVASAASNCKMPNTCRASRCCRAAAPPDNRIQKLPTGSGTHVRPPPKKRRLLLARKAEETHQTPRRRSQLDVPKLDGLQAVGGEQQRAVGEGLAGGELPTLGAGRRRAGRRGLLATRRAAAAAALLGAPPRDPLLRLLDAVGALGGRLARLHAHAGPAEGGGEGRRAARGDCCC